MNRKEIEKLTFNQRLERAGIETIRENGLVFLSYNGSTIPRPDVMKIETTVRTEFQIEI